MGPRNTLKTNDLNDVSTFFHGNAAMNTRQRKVFRIDFKSPVFNLYHISSIIYNLYGSYHMGRIIRSVWYRQFGKINEAQSVNLTVLAFVNHNMRSNLTVQADGKWNNTVLQFYLTDLSFSFLCFSCLLEKILQRLFLNKKVSKWTWVSEQRDCKLFLTKLNLNNISKILNMLIIFCCAV